MSQETSSFTPEGFTSFPSLYQDNTIVSEFSGWTDAALNGRISQYQEFIANSQLPNHISVARRIIDHAIFELTYREGFYE